MNLRNLFESVLNEDYKSDYNDYIDLSKKTDRQSSYVKNRTKDVDILASSGPIKFTYKFDNVYNDWDEFYNGKFEKELKSKGTTVIYIGDKVAWTSEFENPKYFIDNRNEIFINPNITLAELLGKNYWSGINPKEGESGLYLQNFTQMLEAMMSVGLTYPELEQHWKNTYKQALDQFDELTSRKNKVNNAISRRKSKAYGKYQNYVNEMLDISSLEVGDTVRYRAKYGRSGTVDWQDGTILKISDDRKTFTIKSEYGWTNTVEANGRNIAIGEIKPEYTYGFSNDEKKYK